MSSLIAKFSIEYYAGDELRIQLQFVGSGIRTKYLALFGLIRHLYACTDYAYVRMLTVTRAIA